MTRAASPTGEITGEAYKRPYRDRAYRLTGRDVTDILLYLVDRMESRQGLKVPRNYVFPGYISNYRIAADLGMDYKTVKRALQLLEFWGLIKIGWHAVEIKSSKKNPEGMKMVNDSIEVAEPGIVFYEGCSIDEQDAEFQPVYRKPSGKAG